MRRIHIYWIGLIPLSAFYYILKDRLGSPAFFFIGMAYLVVIRLISERFGSDGRWNKKAKSKDMR